MNTMYIYIMTNQTHSVLYANITSNLYRTVVEHQNGVGCDFTSRHQCRKLVYFKKANLFSRLTEEERIIKQWSPNKKKAIVNKVNPKWKDLSYKLMR